MFSFKDANWGLGKYFGELEVCKMGVCIIWCYKGICCSKRVDTVLELNTGWFKPQSGQ